MFGEVFDANPAFMSRYTTEGGLQATLDFGFQAERDRLRQGPPDDGAARPVRRRRLLHRHRLQRLLAADVPRQPRHGPHRQVPRRRRGERRRAARSATAGPLADVPHPRPAGRLLRRRAGLHRRRRRQGRPPGHVPVAGRLVQRRRPDRHRRHDGRRQLRHRATRCTSTSPSCPSCATHTRRWPTAPRSTATPAAAPASTRSAASTPTTRSSTSWPPTTASAAQTVDVRHVQRHGARSAACGRPGTADVAERRRGPGHRHRPAAVGAVVWRATATLRATSGTRRRCSSARPAPAAPSAAGPRSACRVPGGGFNQVTFAWRPAGTATWTALGTDDNAPYRVFHDVTGLAEGHARRVPRRAPGPRRQPRRSRRRRRRSAIRRRRRRRPAAAGRSSSRTR